MKFLQKPLISLNWFLENNEVSAKVSVWFFEKEPKIDVFLMINFRFCPSNPPLNPYLLAPPNLGTFFLKDTKTMQINKIGFW